MALQYPLRVKQTTTTTGTGSLTLIAPAGQQRSFQSHFGNGPIVVTYVISGSGYYEYGYGTFTGPNTLTRDKVIASSNSGAKVALPAATADVFADWPGDSWGIDTHSGSYTLDLADRGNVQEFTTGGSTLNLPALSTVPNGFAVMVNSNFAAGGAATIIDAAGSDTIMGGATLNVPALSAGFLFRNGTEWRFFFYANSGLSGSAILASGNVQTGSGTVLTLDLSGYSAYKRLELDIEGLQISSAGTTHLGIQFATNGGSFTWITSGYVDTAGTAHANIRSAMAISSALTDYIINLWGINQSVLPRAKIDGIWTPSGASSLIAADAGSLPGTTLANAVKIFGFDGSGLNTTAGTYRLLGYQ